MPAGELARVQAGGEDLSLRDAHLDPGASRGALVIRLIVGGSGPGIPYSDG